MRCANSGIDLNAVTHTLQIYVYSRESSAAMNIVIQTRFIVLVLCLFAVGGLLGVGRVSDSPARDVLEFLRHFYDRTWCFRDADVTAAETYDRAKSKTTIVSLGHAGLGLVATEFPFREIVPDSFGTFIKPARQSDHKPLSEAGYLP